MEIGKDVLGFRSVRWLVNHCVQTGLIKQLVSPDEITSKILLFRDKKVMLDSSLAKLYGVHTYVLN